MPRRIGRGSLTGPSLRTGTDIPAQRPGNGPRTGRPARRRPPCAWSVRGTGASHAGRQLCGRLVQLSGDAGDVRVGLGEPGTDLVDDVAPAPWPGTPRCRAWPSACGLLLLGGGQVLRQPLALGLDVDRAGQVERDRGARDRQRRGGAGSPRPAGCRRSSWRMAASCGASAVPSRVEPGRDLLAGLQALVGAEPADLGDDLLERSRSPARRPRRGSRGPSASRR